MKVFNVRMLWYHTNAMRGRSISPAPMPSAPRGARLPLAVAASLLLLLAGCAAGVRYPDYSNTPSPLYGDRPCPGSATSRSGGVATPWNCTVLRDD